MSNAPKDKPFKQGGGSGSPLLAGLTVAVLIAAALSVAGLIGYGIARTSQRLAPVIQAEPAPVVAAPVACPAGAVVVVRPVCPAAAPVIASESPIVTAAPPVTVPAAADDQPFLTKVIKLPAKAKHHKRARHHRHHRRHCCVCPQQFMRIN